MEHLVPYTLVHLKHVHVITYTFIIFTNLLICTVLYTVTNIHVVRVERGRPSVGEGR